MLFIGTDDRADRLCKALGSADGNGAQGVRVAQLTGPSGRAGKPSIEEIKAAIFDRGVSKVVVDPDIEDYDEIVSALIVRKLQGVRVRESQDFFEELHQRVWLEGLSAEWLLFSDGFHQSRAYGLAKRVLDVVVALAIAVLGAPLLAAIAAAIKIDSRGPALFTQERVGRNGEVFTLYKFRSMCEDAEKDTGPVWARERDERVTRIGALLRKTRLDELPQVINILRDDISLVGPRPERPCFVADLSEHIPFYHYRQVLKPGLTGWAQVRKGYADSIEGAIEKLEYDFYYAKHASFPFDLQILLKTVGVVLRRKGQ